MDLYRMAKMVIDNPIWQTENLQRCVGLVQDCSLTFTSESELKNWFQESETASESTNSTSASTSASARASKSEHESKYGRARASECGVARSECECECRSASIQVCALSKVCMICGPTHASVVFLCSRLPVATVTSNTEPCVLQYSPLCTLARG